MRSYLCELPARLLQLVDVYTHIFSCWRAHANICKHKSPRREYSLVIISTYLNIFYIYIYHMVQVLYVHIYIYIIYAYYIATHMGATCDMHSL